jgi:predicted transcriptional regulator
MELRDTDFIRKKRGRFQITHEILSLCQKPTVKTHIMHKCNLSTSNLNEYLKFLISHSLLSSFDGKNGKVYQTTHNGCRFISSYEELRKLLFHKIERVQTERTQRVGTQLKKID